VPTSRTKRPQARPSSATEPSAESRRSRRPRKPRSPVGGRSSGDLDARIASFTADLRRITKEFVRAVLVAEVNRRLPAIGVVRRERPAAQSWGTPPERRRGRSPTTDRRQPRGWVNSDVRWAEAAARVTPTGRSRRGRIEGSPPWKADGGAPRLPYRIADEERITRVAATRGAQLALVPAPVSTVGQQRVQDDVARRELAEGHLVLVDHAQSAVPENHATR